MSILHQIGDSFKQNVVNVSERVADDGLELIFSNFGSLFLLTVQQNGEYSGGVVIVRFVYFGFEVVEDAVPLKLSLQFF